MDCHLAAAAQLCGNDCLYRGLLGMMDRRRILHPRCAIVMTDFEASEIGCDLLIDPVGIETFP